MTEREKRIREYFGMSPKKQNENLSEEVKTKIFLNKLNNILGEVGLKQEENGELVKI